MVNTKVNCQQQPSRVPDVLARLLCEKVRRGKNRKQLLAAALKWQASVRAVCMGCGTRWPIVLLGHDDMQHICVVAKRSSFLSLRRRLERHYRQLRLTCPACNGNGPAFDNSQPIDADQAPT